MTYRNYRELTDEEIRHIVERSSDEVYYNEETERRPKMEANAHLYGLRVMAMG